MSRSMHTLLVLVVGTLLLVATALPAAAGGPKLDKLEEAGWACVDIPPVGIHCDNQGMLMRLERGDTFAAWPELVFDSDTREFLGTEIGIREDLHAGQRCPRDHDRWVHDLGFLWCHHFETQR